MKATVFDYGAGNLHSLGKALERAGVSVVIESDPRRLLDAELLVLPGVGAFGAAAERLVPVREPLREALERGLPCLGICLGLQLLFDGSDESEGQGLGVIPGRVERLAARRVPHIGWNALEDAGEPLLAAAPLPTAYFANGYAGRPADPSCVTAWCTHERDRFAAVVRVGRTIGVQFHPEKSSAPGLAFVAAAVRALAPADFARTRNA